MNKAKKSWFVAMILLLFIIITGDIVTVSYTHLTLPTNSRV